MELSSTKKTKKDFSSNFFDIALLVLIFDQFIFLLQCFLEAFFLFSLNVVYSIAPE